MSKSRRNEESDLTRIVGILFLELVAGIVLINLAQFSQQQRSGQNHDARPTRSHVQSQPQISLPKIAAGRYNVRL